MAEHTKEPCPVCGHTPGFRPLGDFLAEVRSANKKIAALIEAAEELRDDLLMRAEIDREGIAVVAAGNGVWCRFNDALAAVRGEGQ